MMDERVLYGDLTKVLIGQNEIREAVKKLAAQINKEYKGKELMCICILRGAVMFFTDLIRELDLPLTIDFMAISSYGNSTRTSGEVRLQKDLDQSVLDKDVLVVEDIVDSGKKVLVFTQYKEGGVSKLKPLLARNGVECMTGDSTGRERAQAVERFQNDPGRRQNVFGERHAKSSGALEVSHHY